MPVRDASVEDVEEIADILADGFSDDPMFVWMFGGHASALRAWLRLITSLALERGAGQLVDGACAVLWIPPSKRIIGPRVLELAGDLLRAELGAERGAEVLAGLGEIGEYRPPGDSAHLLYIATRKARRGLGLGAQVTAPGVYECDQRRWPAFLNSTTRRNHPFYERLGFRRTGEVEVSGGGPTIYPMWREPR